jgi:hypothetical protein
MRNNIILLYIYIYYSIRSQRHILVNISLFLPSNASNLQISRAFTGKMTFYVTVTVERLVFDLAFTPLLRCRGSLSLIERC